MSASDELDAAARAFALLLEALPRVACPACRRMIHPHDVPPLVFPAHTNNAGRLCPHSGERVSDMDWVR